VETSRSGGPGGQHVNKTETRVTLRFALASSPSLPEEDRLRAVRRLAKRLTRNGELLVSCDRHRERARNLAEAFERLGEILGGALHRPRQRKRTRPPRGAVEERLRAKRRVGHRKQERGRAPPED
jgi:ribosome-associated protein